VALLDSRNPLNDPRGQELLQVLAGLYRNEREAFAFVEQYGIRHFPSPGRTARQLWHRLIEIAANEPPLLRTLVRGALAQFPSNPSAAFLNGLLDDTGVAITARLPVAFDDSVKNHEALLFSDDLTMPVGRIQRFLTSISLVLLKAPSVCLLRLSTQHGEFVGTGFKIARELVLSNHHVLCPRGNPALEVHADFNFDVDETGASTISVPLMGDARSIVGDRARDWAVVRVKGMDPNWPEIELTSTRTVSRGEPAFILQHPKGQRKRLGFVRNTISDVDLVGGVARYLTDTQPGSSGAPVFDANGHCIAIHHAGGTPHEVLGRPPVSKNEGVLVQGIAAALKERNLL
jgi:hypothetical protein